MAEERIIDDEYGRGVRLKKTKDGFVDVTDELADGTDMEEGEEITFEFPNLEGYGMEQDNEALVDLSPEEAFARKKGADENDRLEQAGMQFHNRVYAGYKAIAEKENRVAVVNGRQTPDEIFADVLTVLQTRKCL